MGTVWDLVCEGEGAVRLSDLGLPNIASHNWLPVRISGSSESRVRMRFPVWIQCAGRNSLVKIREGRLLGVVFSKSRIRKLASVLVNVLGIEASQSHQLCSSDRIKCWSHQDWRPRTGQWWILKENESCEAPWGPAAPPSPWQHNPW